VDGAAAQKSRHPQILTPDGAFPRVIQIIFNDISASELSQLPTQTQFPLLEALNIQPADVDDAILGKRYGVLERGGKRLYRCRAGDHRIYFGILEGNVWVHRILHKNSLQDFLYRSNLPGGGEDEALSKSKNFWHLIDEGARTIRVT
jgi:mRNA-degrading endonuclease RelE of RelBE toxin-antitoxin system